MKILLTAPPGIGKSTVIDRVVAQYPGHKHGIVAREILNSAGIRTGFTSVNQAGESRQFMFATAAPDADSIGGLFNVDIKAIDEFVVPELLASNRNIQRSDTLVVVDDGERSSREERLVYIDEIGRAQAKSPIFLATLRHILQSDCNILGSIVYDDEPWSLEFKKDSRLCILDVTRENRDELPEVLLSAFSYNSGFTALNAAQQAMAYDFLRTLVRSNKMDSARKIFINAFGYVNGKKIEQISCNDSCAEYLVHGLTRSHKIVRDASGKFHCDCDLANGVGSFAGKPGLCSHEMSIQLIELK